MLSEVSAVVLSVGEPYTQRAIDSLATQSVPVREVIVIEHVSPFFRAINEGAARVGAPFFVQVDADMILDPTCVEALLARMQPHIGVVVGELRDELFGQIVGVKLFRAACFRSGGMPDSISSDTDFVARLNRLGWRVEYVQAPGADRATLRPTLGEHRPHYTPSYTYRKLLIEGARIPHRAVPHGLIWRMDMLELSVHPLALLAQIAFAHGLFLPLRRDELKPPRHDPRADALAAFLAADLRADHVVDGLLPTARHQRLRDIFRLFVAAGRALAHAGAGATCRDLFAGLSGVRRDPRALVAKVALSHGLLMADEDLAGLPQDERTFRDFLMFSIGSHAGPWGRWRARARHLVRRRGRGAARW